MRHNDGNGKIEKYYKEIEIMLDLGCKYIITCFAAFYW